MSLGRIGVYWNSGDLNNAIFRGVKVKFSFNNEVPSLLRALIIFRTFQQIVWGLRKVFVLAERALIKLHVFCHVARPIILLVFQPRLPFPFAFSCAHCTIAFTWKCANLVLVERKMQRLGCGKGKWKDKERGEGNVKTIGPKPDSIAEMQQQPLSALTLALLLFLRVSAFYRFVQFIRPCRVPRREILWTK